MPTHYDKRGNIPGPGPSRIQPIPRWQSKEDEALIEKENFWGPIIEEASLQGIATVVGQGKFGDTPASEQTIDVSYKNILNDVFPEYSSGPIVKTSKGTMYRPTPGTMQSTFMSVNPNQMKLFGLPTDPAGKEALRIFSENIAKKSGYESMSDFRKNVLNKWPTKDQDQLFRQLWEGQGEGYIEHLTAKGSHMDWYWDMKGKDRNAVSNVRILYNDNLKNLKDTVEKIVYGTPNNPGLGWQATDPKNRLIVSFEDPMRKVKKDYLKQNPGDIIIKRAGNDQIIGNLGQYLDTLYPQDPLLKKVFEEGVSKLGLTPAQFRRQVLSERIGIIIENSSGLPKNATKRKRYIKQFIDDDMVDLTEQYPFLKSRKSITESMDAPGSGVTEADYDKRGQGKNPIPPLGDPRFTKGPFPSKTEMMNIEKAKRKGYVQGDLMDFLQDLFPDE
jgi:hypothetical protein